MAKFITLAQLRASMERVKGELEINENSISEVDRVLTAAIAEIAAKSDVLESGQVALEDKINELHYDVNDLDSEITDRIDEVEAIAKGASVAIVFETFAEAEMWLKNSNNKGILRVGDHIYIKATNTPDYWISAVFTTASAETGYYYEISELEGQSVDLTEYAKKTYVNPAIKTLTPVYGANVVGFEPTLLGGNGTRFDISEASEVCAGVMASTDKAKLNNIEDEATKDEAVPNTEIEELVAEIFGE